MESADWESWVQASNIELCEVRLGFDGLRTCKFCGDSIRLSNLDTTSLDLSTSPLPPLRCDTHSLSSMVFCPGDPHYVVMAEPSPVPITPKMYLCLSFLSFGRYEAHAPGMANLTLSRVDSTIPKSELVVFGLSKRVHPNASVPEWVRYFIAGAPLPTLIINIIDPNKIDIEANSRDPVVCLALPRISTSKCRRRQSECSRISVFKQENLDQNSVR